MQAFLRSHRWSILAAGAAIQILTGIPAAWGVFQRSVCEEYGFESQTASMIFSFVICFFGIGCVVGGFLQDKKGPRAAGLSGTLLLAAGFVGAAFLPAGAAWAFYAAFSLPVGLGCAFLYPAVMSCAQKWYAERKGLATGVIGGAVGLSGALLTVAGRWLIGGWGVRTAFWVLGAAMALVCGAGSLLLENPDETAQGEAVPRAAAPQQDARAPRHPSRAAHADKRAVAHKAVTQQTASATHLDRQKMRTQQRTTRETDGEKAPQSFTVRTLLKTPQYYLLFAATGLATPAVLLFSPIIVEYAQERGLSQAAGLSCIVIGSLFSAAGRLLMPWLSDRIGRRAVDLLLFAALGVFSAAFWAAQGWWVVVLYSLLTFCYSGEAAVIPAAVTDLFGQAQSGVHYGLVALGMSVGSVGFPLLARIFSLGTARHLIAIGAAAAGFVCIWLLRPTQGKRL